MRSSARAWAIASLMAVFLIAAGLEANATRRHLYHALQLPEQAPPSSLDLALYVALDDHAETDIKPSAADLVILQGEPLTVRFSVVNESAAPQIAVEDPDSPAGLIRVSGLVRGTALQADLPVTWTSPQLRNGARRNPNRHELSLPAGSSVGWTGTVVEAETLRPGIYEVAVERTIRDSGGRPARMHTGRLTVEIRARSSNR